MPVYLILLVLLIGGCKAGMEIAVSSRSSQAAADNSVSKLLFSDSTTFWNISDGLFSGLNVSYYQGAFDGELSIKLELIGGPPPRILLVTGNKDILIPLELTLPSAMTEEWDATQIASAIAVFTDQSGTRSILEKSANALGEGRIMVNLSDWGVIALTQPEDAAQDPNLQAMIDSIVAEKLAEQTSTGSQSTSDFKVIKIIAAGSGKGTEVGTDTIQVGAAKTYRAALFSSSGSYLEDTTVQWSLTGTTFSDSDLSQTGSASATATFTPSKVGTTTLSATYNGADTSVVSRVDVTGVITVTSNKVPASMITVSGDNQSGAVDQTLAAPLKVKIIDSFNLGVPGITVQFSVVSGGGQVVGSTAVLTDADGVASASVKVGTVAGANIFRATYSTMTRDFNATALAGSGSSLVFATAPSGLYEGESFTTQPVVSVRDQFGNTSSVSGTVTLSKQAGTGNLSGTLTANLTNGVATFSNVAYDTAEAGLIIRASYGSLTVDTAALTVNEVPGKCSVSDAAFSTAEGGCKDLTSGLVWSSLSAANMTWHDAVWDSDLAGNASTQDAGDLGRTNDYPASDTACLGNCDSSVTNYCHDLTEGGRNDWRLPSLEELVDMRANAAAGAGATAYLESAGNFALHTATTHGTTANNYTFNISTNATSNVAKSTSRAVYCVRGGRTAADRLVVLSGPDSAAVGTTSQPLVVQVRDSLGNSANVADLAVALATDLGSLAGTTSGWSTDNTGRATVSDWNLDTAGTVQLTVSASGLTSGNHVVSVLSSFAHTCLLNDSVFATADGGCKDLQSGLTWSNISGTMFWHEAIWGGLNTPAGNVGADAFDGTLTHHYDSVSGSDGVGGFASGSDASIVNYCHSLNESGKQDWRVATKDELITIAMRSASSYFDFNTNQSFWAATTVNAANAYLVNLSSGADTNNDKNNNYPVTCVRQ